MMTIRMAALVLMAAGSMPGAALAASDACCGDPLTCFCYKDTAGDWKQGGLAAKIPPKAQTKGEKFKQRDLSKAALKVEDKKAKP